MENRHGALAAIPTTRIVGISKMMAMDVRNAVSHPDVGDEHG
jgi:hypothetical protein